MIPLSSYSEVHVVSDLHLGGEGPPEQIFDQGEAFAALIDILLSSTATTAHGLVINGDLADFLAEPGAMYFDPAGAADKLDRILRDPSFVPVWDALRKYVSYPNRTLILTLGNHDIELALPWVRRQLLQELSSGNAEALARIELAYEEGGYRCRVGKADVLCVHGNEVDPWNVTDYEQLRRVGAGVLRGTDVQAWTPNGGSKLVIDVMNDVKARFPFVDLLKPEGSAVIPTLLVLDPSLAPRIGDAVPAWFRSLWDRIRVATGFLEAEGSAIGQIPQDQMAQVTVLGSMLGETFGAAVRTQNSVKLDDLLERTEQRLRQGVSPLALLGGTNRPEYLGLIEAIVNMIRGSGRAAVLRQALEKLRTDRSFGLKTADDTYRALDQKTTAEIDFLISGHTHLQRAIPRSQGKGHYYNSGTWARLIQFTDEMLKSEEGFEPIYKALKMGTMAGLDCQPGLILRRPTIVSLWADGTGTHCELRQVNPKDMTLVPLDGSRTTRS